MYDSNAINAVGSPWEQDGNADDWQEDMDFAICPECGEVTSETEINAGIQRCRWVCERCGNVSEWW